MRIIAKRILREFWEQPGHQDAKQPLKAWYAEVRRAAWRTPADVKAKYGSASLLPSGRVVFNIGGDKNRLIFLFRYDKQKGVVRFFGAHEADDPNSAEAN